MTTTTKDDGGPAFTRGEHHLGHNGISIRDYFAAKAMQGFCVNDEYSFSKAAELACPGAGVSKIGLPKAAYAGS